MHVWPEKSSISISNKYMFIEKELLCIYNVCIETFPPACTNFWKGYITHKRINIRQQCNLKNAFVTRQRSLLRNRQKSVKLFCFSNSILLFMNSFFQTHINDLVYEMPVDSELDLVPRMLLMPTEKYLVYCEKLQFHAMPISGLSCS